MKFKSLFMLGLLLLTLYSISAIYADTYVVGNSSFSLPDGYALSEKGNQTVIFNDEYVLTMYEGPILTPDVAKNNRIKKGYRFLGERDYEFDGAEINQQNYNKDGVNSCVYTFKKNGQTYIITLNLFEDQIIPEYGENPVTQIIDTLETVS
ncbi:MAG: hypothetical protein E7Z85_05660 [Methanosphaera stadtmanae]|nr:hypothetical protein [Methanosphaera stadtmanae]